MSSQRIASPNAVAVELRTLLAHLLAGDATAELAGVAVDWTTGEVTGMPVGLATLLSTASMARIEDARVVMTQAGLAMLGRLLVDLPALLDDAALVDGRYRICELIADGKNSTTFLARHELLQRNAVLKVIRPGTAPNLRESIQKLSLVADSPYLVQPTDYFIHPYSTVTGDPIALECLVFPFVAGPTLAAYLASEKPLSPSLVPAFIRQVSSALAALEEAGLTHGDFHSRNILVSDDQQGRLTFQIIDLSCGVGLPSKYSSSITDFEHFKMHLFTIVGDIQRRQPQLSLRKHLGARWASLVERILTLERATFRDILALCDDGTTYEAFRIQRDRFIADHFRRPVQFGLLRYEEINDPVEAAQLFEPLPELFRHLQQFGSTILYGPRGSGKSTYLASLAFFPEATSSRVDFHEIFGVFFACRQGEFKQFTPDLIEFDGITRAGIKHIFVLKVARRLIKALSTAIQHGRLTLPSEWKLLYDFFEQHVDGIGLSSFDATLVSPLDNLHSVLLRSELQQIGMLFRDRKLSVNATWLNELRLAELCTLIRRVFPELVATRFYFLFDDAGEPNVHDRAQRIMNELVRCANHDFCVKLSAERYSLSMVDPTGKVIEEGHDVTILDIARQFSMGAGVAPERRKVEEYFKRLLAARFKRWGYASDDITQYLGDRPIDISDLVARLASSRRDAYYAGWTIVWQLADRNPRTLLELVSEILIEGAVEPKSLASHIPLRIQDRAVKAVSDRKLRGLGYIPGSLSVFGKDAGLGRQLQLFAMAFGKISRAYLTRPASKQDRHVRYDERLGIERNDSLRLPTEATAVLQQLIKFGVLDDSTMEVSRQEGIKKPVYILNRVLCPAFEISIRRQTNLRLATKRFVELLLAPAETGPRATKFLRSLDSRQNEMEV